VQESVSLIIKRGVAILILLVAASVVVFLPGVDFVVFDRMPIAILLKFAIDVAVAVLLISAYRHITCLLDYYIRAICWKQQEQHGSQSVTAKLAFNVTLFVYVCVLYWVFVPSFGPTLTTLLNAPWFYKTLQLCVVVVGAVPLIRIFIILSPILSKASDSIASRVVPTTEAEATIMCVQCGVPVEQGSKFCSSCGAQISASEQQTPVAETPQNRPSEVGGTKADILFACTHCGQNLEVEAAGAGMVVSCPKCSSDLEVPRLPIVVKPSVVSPKAQMHALRRPPVESPIKPTQTQRSSFALIRSYMYWLVGMVVVAAVVLMAIFANHFRMSGSVQATTLTKAVVENVKAVLEKVKAVSGWGSSSAEPSSERTVVENVKAAVGLSLGEGPKIKGIQIGLNIYDVCKEFNEKYAEMAGGKCKVTPVAELKSKFKHFEDQLGFAILYEGFPINDAKGYIITTDDRIGFLPRIFADEKQQIIKFMFSPSEIAALFRDIAHLSGEDFAQQFVQAYNIPKMKPFQENDSMYGWKHISPEGILVKIYANKNISVEKIKLSGKGSFE
jgi:DNA-directed RNA polymerase subunit RPC12/RpoP